MTAISPGLTGFTGYFLLLGFLGLGGRGDGERSCKNPVVPVKLGSVYSLCMRQPVQPKDAWPASHSLAEGSHPFPPMEPTP